MAGCGKSHGWTFSASCLKMGPEREKMHKEDQSLKRPRPLRQRYFVAKELQFSIALLTVIALLGGIFLQAVSSALIDYWGLQTPFLGVFLVIGYIVIVVVLAMFFSHRLVGPFKRLEYEMKFIADGNITKRLSIRGQDDLHIRNFVKYSNRFIDKFARMSQEYDALNSTVSKKMDEISVELSKDSVNCEKIQHELRTLQSQIEGLRAKR